MNASAQVARVMSSLIALAMLMLPMLPSAADTPKIDAGETLALMEKVADWQLAHLEPVESIKFTREETRGRRAAAGGLGRARSI